MTKKNNVINIKDKLENKVMMDALSDLYDRDFQKILNSMTCVKTLKDLEKEYKFGVGMLLMTHTEEGYKTRIAQLDVMKKMKLLSFDLEDQFKKKKYQKKI